MKNYIPLVVPLYNLSEQTPRSVPSFSYTRNIYLLKKTETICSIHQQTSYPLSKTLSSCRDKCLFRTRSEFWYKRKKILFLELLTHLNSNSNRIYNLSNKLDLLKTSLLILFLFFFLSFFLSFFFSF